LQVFRTVANRTRSGVKSLRNLFSGRRNKNTEEGGSTTGRSFLKFFGNLLNRILVFLTNLWERITGFFQGRRTTTGDDDGSGGESTGKKLIKRIRTGASALATRLRGGSGGGSGGGILASLTMLLGPQTTVEPYEPDYESEKDLEKDKDKESSEASSTDSYSSTSTTTTKGYDDDNDKSGNYESSGGYGGYSSNAARNPETEYNGDNSAASTINAGRFIPFPMDSDPNYHLNGAPSYYTAASTNPWARSSVQASPYYSYYT